MEKIYGATERNDGIFVYDGDYYVINYGFGEDEQGTFIYSERLKVKPSSDFVKDMVLSQINANTQEKIVSGFRWNDTLVWLSEANQLNYARDFLVAAYLHEQGEQLELPTYKFGTDETPIYYTFQTFEEFKAFSAAWAKHISDAVRDGWHEKANVDWSGYSL